MDNDFLRNQVKLGEQANAYADLNYSNDQKRRAEDRLRESENNLAHAQRSKEAEEATLKREKDKLIKTREKNLTSDSNIISGINPYFIKNKIYSKVLEEVFSKLPTEDKEKFECLFLEKYKEKIKDETSYIQIYNKQKKTSNY
ncbi:hypothetical protein [Enterobacter hormaechei]|uniref:hypothetical protein n=1 Tax=Enterobacter hormaechei TaxID=158836 RepID=UPI0005F9286C|nr:hypothetical protein [Enterobacter hormaechei]KJX33883.1 hypothetical protein SG76_03685 [Enterobacter hormaechei subsp. steigerwaltii]MDL4630257.1 hypothetical protein [Enterobacter hormaechei]